MYLGKFPDLRSTQGRRQSVLIMFIDCILWCLLIAYILYHYFLFFLDCTVVCFVFAGFLYVCDCAVYFTIRAFSLEKSSDNRSLALRIIDSFQWTIPCAGDR